MYENKKKITVSNYLYHGKPKRCGPFFLVQAGESFCSKDTVIDTHSQSCFELTYVCGGSGVCYADGVPTEIQKNDCFFSFPDETHSIESDADNPLHFMFLAFNVKAGTRESKYLDLIRSAVLKGYRKIGFEEIGTVLAVLLRELKGEDEYTSRMLRSYLENVLVGCCRKLSDKGEKVYPVRYSDRELLVKDILLYIQEHIESISCVQDVSAVFHYTAQSLSKIFRARMGIPIGKYLADRKMEFADQLLKEGLSVTAVSAKLGYSSIHTFSRAYKGHFHRMPSEKRPKSKKSNLVLFQKTS